MLIGIKTPALKKPLAQLQHLWFHRYADALFKKMKRRTAEGMVVIAIWV